MYQVNSKINEKLCNQVIDTALVIKEFEGVVNTGKVMVPQKFIDRVNSVMGYVHQLFMDYNANKLNGLQLQEKMITLMAKLIEYRNSYKVGGYGYRMMNSLFDIVNTTYVTIDDIA